MAAGLAIRVNALHRPAGHVFHGRPLLSQGAVCGKQAPRKVESRGFCCEFLVVSSENIRYRGMLAEQAAASGKATSDSRRARGLFTLAPSDVVRHTPATGTRHTPESREVRAEPLPAIHAVRLGGRECDVPGPVLLRGGAGATASPAGHGGAAGSPAGLCVAIRTRRAGHRLRPRAPRTLLC